MIVRIEIHGQRISGPCHWMRRLQHLPGIERVEVGVIVRQPVCRGLQNPRHRRGIDGRLKLRQRPKLRLEQLCGSG